MCADGLKELDRGDLQEDLLWTILRRKIWSKADAQHK